MHERLMLGNRKVTINGSRFRISCMSKYARDTHMPSPRTVVERWVVCYCTVSDIGGTPMMISTCHYSWERLH